MATETISDVRGMQASIVPRRVVAQPQQEGKVVEGDKQRSVQEKALSSPSEKDVQDAVTTLSNHFQNIQRNLDFSVDEDSGVTVVKVVDSESQEVIRQIPSEEALALVQHLRNHSGDESGIFIHSKA